MNFEEWFNTELPRQPIRTYKRDIELGWNSCKKQTLQILNKYIYKIHPFDSDKEDIEAIDINTIKDIEKL